MVWPLFVLEGEMGNPAPLTGLQAKLSVHHCAAAAFVHGRVGVREFTDACVHDPAVVALRSRTVLVEAPALPKEAAEVTVRLNDGSTLHTYVAQATGSVARPMSDEALARKFGVLAGWGWPDCDTRRFIELVWSLDELTDASAFPRAAAPR